MKQTHQRFRGGAETDVVSATGAPESPTCVAEHFGINTIFIMKY